MNENALPMSIEHVKFAINYLCFFGEWHRWSREHAGMASITSLEPEDFSREPMHILKERLTMVRYTSFVAWVTNPQTTPILAVLRALLEGWEGGGKRAIWMLRPLIRWLQEHVVAPTEGAKKLTREAIAMYFEAFGDQSIRPIDVKAKT